MEEDGVRTSWSSSCTCHREDEGNLTEELLGGGRIDRGRGERVLDAGAFWGLPFIEGAGGQVA